MYAHDLFEAGKPNIVVTYPGRFQPFHQGHAGVFAQLQKKFGRDAVYILTSNDQSSAKSPFNFTDKYQLITAAGVHGDRIIETNKMYVLPEGFDPSNTIFITAVGAPDATRLSPDSVLKRDRKDAEGNVIKAAGSPSYYKTWNDNDKHVTADQHGYVIVIPEIKKSIKIDGQEYDVSHGTECRNLWNQVRDNKEAADIFLKQLYGKATPELAHIFNKIPVVNEDVDLDSADSTSPIHGVKEHIIKHGSGYRLVSKKTGKNLGDFGTKAAAEKHEREVEYFKHAKEGIEEARIIDPDSKMDLYYVTRSGQKQIVFQGIPQHMLEKAVMVLRTKYPQIKITDIEMRPSSHNEYRRSSQPELAEDSNKFILYVNNEPAAKYVNVDDARLMRDNLKKKYPSAKIELKQEKCDLINIKEQSVAEDAAGVGVVAKNKKMAKDPRYSMSMTKDVKPNTPKDMLRAFRLAEDEDFGDFDAAVRQLKESKEKTPEFPELLAKFLPLAMQTLKLKHLPEIKLEKHVDTHDGQATFGRYINEEGVIHLAIADRHPLDILRTLAHELCHYKQDTLKELTSGSGRTGSPEENEAHVMAGIIMRHFNKKYPNLIKLNPINMK